ncbi:MAG TPA: hypothetical protein VKB56_08480, partial [Terriglobales bacterium]|nr:hypothetical protein [Terriglobales bacterium]
GGGFFCGLRGKEKERNDIRAFYHRHRESAGCRVEESLYGDWRIRSAPGPGTADDEPELTRRKIQCV